MDARREPILAARRLCHAYCCDGRIQADQTDGEVTFYNTNGTLGYIEDADGNKITAGYNGSNQLTTLTANTGGDDDHGL